MAGSVNKVILLGNLGRDPEVRTTQSGMKVVTLRLATSESWNDRTTGERQERTEWHSVVIMNDRLAEVAERYLRKGSKVYVEGKLQTRKWTDQSGQDRYTTEVLLGRIGAELVLLDRRESAPADFAEEERGPTVGRSAGASSGGRQGGWEPKKGGVDLDDDIPF